MLAIDDHDLNQLDAVHDFELDDDVDHHLQHPDDDDVDHNHADEHCNFDDEHG